MVYQLLIVAVPMLIVATFLWRKRMTTTALEKLMSYSVRSPVHSLGITTKPLQPAQLAGGKLRLNHAVSSLRSARETTLWTATVVSDAATAAPLLKTEADPQKGNRAVSIPFTIAGSPLIVPREIMQSAAPFHKAQAYLQDFSEITPATDDEDANADLMSNRFLVRESTDNDAAIAACLQSEEEEAHVPPYEDEETEEALRRSAYERDASANLDNDAAIAACLQSEEEAEVPPYEDEETEEALRRSAYERDASVNLDPLPEEVVNELFHPMANPCDDDLLFALAQGLYDTHEYLIDHTFEHLNQRVREGMVEKLSLDDFITCVKVHRSVCLADSVNVVVYRRDSPDLPMRVVQFINGGEHASDTYPIIRLLLTEDGGYICLATEGSGLARYLRSGWL
jgi:hypothetical protein